MEPLVDVLTEDGRWDALDLAARADAAARVVFARLGLPGPGFLISLLGCSDSRIAELNEDFRGKPQPTNVLSWPSVARVAPADGGRPRLPKPGEDEDPVELGDIAIAWETCVRESETLGITLDSHVMHLLVHGVLHLLGYDHERQGDADLMETTEREILADLGIADPYA